MAELALGALFLSAGFTLWVIFFGPSGIEEHNERVYRQQEKARKEGRQDTWLATRDPRGMDDGPGGM